MTREEALKIVRDIYEKSLFLKKDKEAIETLFPEFKDSEDEKIRKEILEYFRQFEGEKLRGVDISDWIAWLEKKKGEEKRQYDLGVQAGKEEAMHELKPSTEQLEALKDAKIRLSLEGYGLCPTLQSLIDDLERL